MKPANPRLLTINGGSSSIRFALFKADDSLRRILEGGDRADWTAVSDLDGERIEQGG
jgi:acetate kinase